MIVSNFATLVFREDEQPVSIPPVSRNTAANAARQGQERMPDGIGSASAFVNRPMGLVSIVCRVIDQSPCTLALFTSQLTPVVVYPTLKLRRTHADDVHPIKEDTLHWIGLESTQTFTVRLQPKALV